MSFLKKHRTFLFILFLIACGAAFCAIYCRTNYIELHLSNMRENPILLTKFGYSQNLQKDTFFNNLEKNNIRGAVSTINYDENDKDFILEFKDKITGKEYSYQFPMIKDWAYLTCAYTVRIIEDGLFVKGCGEPNEEDSN